MNYYIITYDITNDKRRNHIHKLLCNYAVPVQYSVFEALITEEDYLMLRSKLEGIIKKNEDNIIFYRQCRHCQGDVVRMGKDKDNPINEGIIII